MIQTKNLDIFYGENKIVKNMNIEFKENSITAIIGPSGCGKTTFLVSMNRILEDRGGHYTGEILLNNKSILDYKLNYLRTNVGMVFQKPTAFPLSIKENINMVLKYHGMENDVSVEDILKKVALYDEVKNNLDASAYSLSGGQMQRLSIARSIAIKPKVLLLDEPCSSLDILNTKIIEDLLIELKNSMTIIIVTHNLGQAKRISDYTLFMMNGEKVEYDNTEKLFSSPTDNRTKDYVQGLFG